MMKNNYGVYETNPIPAGYHNDVNPSKSVPWSTKGLRVIRLRLLSDPGFPVWDVSYCHGILDGEYVRVSLPFNQLPKKGLKQFLVEEARKDGIYAKELGILDESIISKLC